jgi:hypothetical protein
MAYNPDGLSLNVDGLSSQSSQTWLLDGTDSITAALADGYIDDAAKRGVRVGDVVRHRQWTEFVDQFDKTPPILSDTITSVSAINENGAATLIEATSSPISWPNRGDLSGDLQAGLVLPDGALMSDGTVFYIYESGATAIADMPNALPFGVTKPNHFAENTAPGSTPMLAAFQSATNYEIEKVGAAVGYFGRPSPVVEFIGSQSYYIEGAFSAERDARSLKLRGHGCRLVTDFNGPLLSFGDADVFTADAAGTVATYGIHVVGFKFVNTNLTAASSIAIRLGRCWNAVIDDNVFYDFWLDVDCHGVGHSWIERNQGFLRDRTATKQAFARFQGVYASDNDKIDGTGIHFNHNEISGLPADSTAQANFIEIKSVDGFYFAQNHAQHINCFLRVEPAGSADNYKNNRTFDIISNGGNYADNPGGNQVRIIGTVAYTGGGGRQNGLYKNVKLDRSDWIRGAGVAQSGATVNVTDGGGYADQFGGLTGIELRGHFDQHTGTPISVLGANSGRLECIGLEIEARFSSARSGSGGGSGCAFVEANSVFIHDCIVGAEDNAPDYVFTLNLSSTGADAAVTITGNDYSKSTYAIAPHNISAPLETSVSVYGNISKAGAGRIIKEEFRILADQGEVAIPWTYSFPGNETGIDVKIRALGQSHPTQGLQDRTTGSEAAGTFYRNAAAATSNIGGFGSQIYLNTNIGTNDAPVWPVLMTGDAWPTTTAVNAGDVYVAGGNVYLVIVGGTTGASQPTHTNGFASTGTETSAYVGAESVNTISAVLGGNTSTRMYWTGEVEILQAR